MKYIDCSRTYPKRPTKGAAAMKAEYINKMRSLLGVLFLISFSADAFSVETLDMTSSVMWQEVSDSKKYVYPPGIPAVLKSSQEQRKLYIEQYFSNEVDKEVFETKVQGSWTNGSLNTWTDQGSFSGNSL
jgi:hypothetical protein